MICYQIDLNTIQKVLLLGKETLIPPHRHLTRRVSEYVVYVMVRGSLHLTVNGETEALLPGDIYLFAPGDEQAPLQDSFCEYYYLHFLSDSITEISVDDAQYRQALAQKRKQLLRTDVFGAGCYDFLRVCVKKKNRIESDEAFAAVQKAFLTHTLSSESRFPRNRLAVSVMLADLFLTLEERSDTGSAQRTENSTKIYDTVRRIAAYIEENYARAIGSSDIEREFFLSFDYCNRIFGQIMGCSIVQYRNMVRIQRAKADFRTLDRSVSETAASVGFENTYYFSRIFKSSEGLTPSEYKKKFMKPTVPVASVRES